MPVLKINGRDVEVPEGKRLVNALIAEGGIDQLHACGGKGKCTTCKVKFLSGEPEKMTLAEKEVLAKKELTGVRLSCQLVCDRDMEIEIISRLEGSGRADAGSPPADVIEPEPEWVDIS